MSNKYNIPKHFFDAAKQLADAGRFNVRPNFTGKKKGGRPYVMAMNRKRAASLVA